MAGAGDPVRFDMAAQVPSRRPGTLCGYRVTVSVPYAPSAWSDRIVEAIE
jgi:hypothetical protein